MIQYPPSHGVLHELEAVKAMLQEQNRTIISRGYLEDIVIPMCPALKCSLSGKTPQEKGKLINTAMKWAGFKPHSTGSNRGVSVWRI